MKIIQLFAFHIFIVSFAFASLQINSNHLEYFDKLCQYKDTCIKSFSDDKIYFKKKQIEYTKNGIFINLNFHEKIPIPELSYDKKGAYLSITTLNNHPGYIRCFYCGMWRTKGLSHCISKNCIDSY